MLTNPWDRQPDEPGHCYQWFTFYLGRGSRRSLREVAKHFTVGRATVEEASVTWKWRQRIELFQAEQARQYMDRLQKELKGNITREIEAVLRYWRGVILPSIIRMERAYRKDKDLKLGPRDLREAVRDFAAALATMRGEPSGIVGIMGQPVPTLDARRELIRALQQVTQERPQQAPALPEPPPTEEVTH